MLNWRAPVCPGPSLLIIAVGWNWYASFDWKKQGLFCWGYGVFFWFWGLTDLWRGQKQRHYLVVLGSLWGRFERPSLKSGGIRKKRTSAAKAALMPRYFWHG